MKEQPIEGVEQSNCYIYLQKISQFRSHGDECFLLIFFSFFNEFDNIFEIIGRNFLVFGKERNHFFVRVLKVVTNYATHKMAFIFISARGSLRQMLLWYKEVPVAYTLQQCLLRNSIVTPKCRSLLLLLVQLTFPWRCCLITNTSQIYEYFVNKQQLVG